MRRRVSSAVATTRAREAASSARLSCVGDRRGDELRELGHPRLEPSDSAFFSLPARDHDAPRPSLDQTGAPTEGRIP